MCANILAWTLGPWEIALVLIAALLLFGGRKLPELARGLGRGLRLFKKEVHGVKDSFDEATEAEEEQDEPEPQDQPDTQADQPGKKKKK